MPSRRPEVPTPRLARSPIISKEVTDSLAVAFEFNLFQTESVRCGDFHNFCENRAAALAQVSDLFCALRDMSQHKRNELEARPLREQLRWHRIEKERPVERINRVLDDGYHMPSGMINEFENEFVEFTCSNGQRVICVTHDNVIVPLFMDPNHLICQDGKAGRNVRQKMSWSFPSFLCAIKNGNEEIAYSDDDEARAMIIEEIKQGNFTDVAEIQQTIKKFGL